MMIDGDVDTPMWDALLKTVRCEIISFTRNDQIDAYVLSESSMFVSKRRWILKTCGTTTPLQCFEPLLRLASEIAGYGEIEDLFYSRKNYKRPELQVSPHRGFEEEVAFLDSFFDDGRAYSLGAINRDCWHLYTLSRGGGGSKIQKRNNHLHQLMDQQSQQQQQQQLQHHNAQLIEASMQPDPDQTIEILMTDLDPNVMAIFTKDVCTTAKEATQKSGIHRLLPGMIIDDYLFDPCGYSMNGISKNGCYMTIHITPEREFSYVSFESNVASSDYGELIARVIRTFQPGKFIVTVFANKTSIAANANREIEHLGTIDQWKRRDIQYSRANLPFPVSLPVLSTLRPSSDAFSDDGPTTGPPFTSRSPTPSGEQMKRAQHQKNTASSPLPLSLAFVHLIFGMFPALTSLGGGDAADAGTEKPERRDGKCFKRQLNVDRRRVDELRSLQPGPLYSYLHPYRAPADKPTMNQMDLPAPTAFADPQHQRGDETVTTNNEYNYGQLKKLIDLPVLFAICFVQLISFVLVLNIEECSPLVLFSWWRNKIS
uniref:Uncharacterized protein n=1 Tax=Anopheles dirus TaxID=7168 RepID=A0A182NB14_9DIPT